MFKAEAKKDFIVRGEGEEIDIPKFLTPVAASHLERRT